MQNKHKYQAFRSRFSLSRTRAVLKPLVIALGIITVFPVTASVDTTEVDNSGLWRNVESLPYRVQEIYPTLFNGHIVVAGGISPDAGKQRLNPTDQVVFYSLSEKKWEEGPTLPEPRHHPMLVVVNDRLLSFGGFTADANGTWHNSLDVLELVIESGSSKKNLLSQGRWKKIAEMPAPLAETLSTVHDGKVHLVSGRTPKDAENNSRWIDQSDVATHYQFDPENLTWTTAPQIPTARNSACSVKTKGKLHTIAGRTVSGGNLASHEAYNFTEGKWQKLAPLPQAQGGLACAAYQQYIYVFGGEYFDNGGGVYSEVWEYNIDSDKWRLVGDMPAPRHGLGALTVGNEIFVIAGALQVGGNQTSDIMSVFNPQKLKRD